MHNSIVKISFLVIATVCLLWGPVGCGGDDETAPAQPEVVATKIQTTAPKPAKADKSAAPAPTQAAKPAAAPAGGKPAEDESALQQTMAGIEKEAAAGSVSRYQARLYKPEGKIDPFENPFQQSAPSGPDQAPEEDKNKPERIRQTPLERIDLS